MRAMSVSTTSAPLDRRLSIAPMMDWTDRFDRYFLRLITRRALLYTEMVTTGAVLNGDRDRLLGFDAAEHPVACQLGGSDPADLAASARVVEDFGYDEINLNVGCPSDRVQSGRFGACLMADPVLVRDCIKAMRDAVDIPVTVKSRIGIDGREDYDDLHRFVETVAQSGCDTFIIHARVAVLGGLSPKENREIPPLKYDFVRRIKQEFPRFSISLNGGVKTLGEAKAHLEDLDGVMIGRAAYQTPYMLAEADRLIFGDDEATPKSRHTIVREMLPYIETELSAGHPLHRITRHILGLFQGVPGAKRWRRYLSQNAYGPTAGPEVVEQALALVPEDVATQVSA